MPAPTPTAHTLKRLTIVGGLAVLCGTTCTTIYDLGELVIPILEFEIRGAEGSAPVIRFGVELSSPYQALSDGVTARANGKAIPPAAGPYFEVPLADVDFPATFLLSQWFDELHFVVADPNFLPEWSVIEPTSGIAVAGEPFVIALGAESLSATLMTDTGEGFAELGGLFALERGAGGVFSMDWPGLDEGTRAELRVAIISYECSAYLCRQYVRIPIEFEPVIYEGR